MFFDVKTLAFFEFNADKNVGGGLLPIAVYQSPMN